MPPSIQLRTKLRNMEDLWKANESTAVKRNRTSGINFNLCLLCVSLKQKKHQSKKLNLQNNFLKA